MNDVEPLSSGQSLAVGAEGNHVQALQEMLQHLGYYQGQVDAQYGGLLEEAVKEFQRAVGHQDDGQTGVETWHEILHQVQAATLGQEPAAEEAAIQLGQLSEDGAWQWNGTEWVAAGSIDAGTQEAQAETASIQVGQLSEDGHWQWNGTEWVAAGGSDAGAQAGQEEHTSPGGDGNGQAAEGAGDGANHPAFEADPNADIPKLSQDDFRVAIADTMTVHAGEEA